MATGVTGKEMIGSKARIATRQQPMDGDLPPPRSGVALAYADKASPELVLSTAPGRYSLVTKAGEAVSAARVQPDTFMLTDNMCGLSALVEQGTKPTLVYMDPPYGTGLDFQSRDLEHAYGDAMDLAAYVESLRRRLILIREALSEDGSLYIHIGHHMLAHVKLVVDEVFGQSNFRNIITRKKCSSKNFTSKQYSNLNDFVLFYTKSKNYKWNRPGRIPDEEWIAREYPKVDAKGRYKLVPVHAPGTRNGECGMPWRGMSPPPGKHWQYVPAKLDELDARGEIHWSKTGNPRRKVYLEPGKKVGLTDYWSDYRDAHHQSIAITGYPTEKNIDMLRMIVAASSDSGDLILDPYCGSGTTLEAAHLEGRRWIGMDRSFTAAKATLTRLRHGRQQMGDYVPKDTPTAPDLFAGRSGNQQVIKRPASLPLEFSFLVESALLGEHPAEVSGLARI